MEKYDTEDTPYADSFMYEDTSGYLGMPVDECCSSASATSSLSAILAHVEIICSTVKRKAVQRKQ